MNKNYKSANLLLNTPIISPSNSEEDIFVLDSILSQFIPMFNEIKDILSETDNKKIINLIHELIIIVGNLNNPLNKNRKKKVFVNCENNIKYEEKEFLYKTYIISSSDKNEGTFKFFSDDTLKINNITPQMIRGLLILIKEELGVNLSGNLNTNLGNLTSMSNKFFIEKLLQVKKLIIIENKSFDFKLLYILLNFIILKFCVNLTSINFEGVLYSKIDQVDIMIKNGVYLNFIHRSKNLTKFSITNKIEFLNENVAFKLMHEYCAKNSLSDVNTEKIEFNKINIFSILTHKTNLTKFIVKKTSIDKNSTILSLIEIFKSNLDLKEVYIDKFVSIPEHFRRELLTGLKKLKKLKKLKINVIYSSKEDLKILNIPKTNTSIKKLNLKLSRVSLEENDVSDCSYFKLRETKLQKMSLNFEKFSPFSDGEDSVDKDFNIPKLKLNSATFLLTDLLPENLRELSLGQVDQTFLQKFIKLPPDYMLKLKTLKLSFLPIDDDRYDEAYNNIIFLLENCRFVKFFQFDNFVIKFKQICDEGFKSILKENTNLQKLVIRSELPFHVQCLEGFYYFDYPKFIIPPLLFSFKKNKTLSKIYHKKSVIINIIEFHRIKKEKIVYISYKI